MDLGPMRQGMRIAYSMALVWTIPMDMELHRGGRDDYIVNKA